MHFHWALSASKVSVKSGVWFAATVRVLACKVHKGDCLRVASITCWPHTRASFHAHFHTGPTATYTQPSARGHAHAQTGRQWHRQHWLPARPRRTVLDATSEHSHRKAKYWWGIYCSHDTCSISQHQPRRLVELQVCSCPLFRLRGVGTLCAVTRARLTSSDTLTLTLTLTLTVTLTLNLLHLFFSSTWLSLQHNLDSSLVDEGSATGGSFRISAEDPAALKMSKWAMEPNPWLHAYFFFSWADGYAPLKSATSSPDAKGMIDVTVGMEGVACVASLSANQPLSFAHEFPLVRHKLIEPLACGLSQCKAQRSGVI